MNEQREFDLLSDIAKLLTKYGSDTFGRLAGDLANPELREQIIQILSKTIELAPNRKTSSKRTKPMVEQKADFRAKLSALDPEKSNLLIRFYDALEAKELLPSLRSIQMFAQDNGFPEVKAKSRDKAVLAFVKMFSSMSVAEIEMLLKTMALPDRASDRSLERWSEIIFGDKLQK